MSHLIRVRHAELCFSSLLDTFYYDVHLPLARIQRPMSLKFMSKQVIFEKYFNANLVSHLLL